MLKFSTKALSDFAARMKRRLWNFKFEI